MKTNPAREKFLPMLSPYVDGELTAEERQLVEQHLANNPDSAAQVADFRAADALMRHALELSADDVDWKGFTDEVMGKLAPHQLPLFERLRLSLSELFTWQRGPLMAGLVGAAVAVAVAIPLTMKLATPDGYGGAKVLVQNVDVDADMRGQVQPVVMETDNGDAVIWVVDDATKPDAGKKKKKGGEEGEEELLVVPRQDGEL
jgi:anti-sigma factor RsiW